MERHPPPSSLQGEPRRRGGGLSVPSTPGKQRPPHPHGKVCRGGGDWVAVSCACGPGELATGSSGAVTVTGRAGHLPQGQWPLGGPVSISGWTLVSPEAPRGALGARGVQAALSSSWLRGRLKGGAPGCLALGSGASCAPSRSAWSPGPSPQHGEAGVGTRRGLRRSGCGPSLKDLGASETKLGVRRPCSVSTTDSGRWGAALRRSGFQSASASASAPFLPAE